MFCVRFLYCKVVENIKSGYVSHYLNSRLALVGFSLMEEFFMLFLKMFQQLYLCSICVWNHQKEG